MKYLSEKLNNITIFGYPMPINLASVWQDQDESEAELIERLSR